MRELVLTAPTQEVPPLRAVVEAYIEWGLTRCGGNVAEAADLLQVSRDLLREWEPNKPGDVVRITDREDASPVAVAALEIPSLPSGATVEATSLGYVLR